MVIIIYREIECWSESQIYENIFETEESHVW